MKKLTLQIHKENFDTILNGVQKVEHRNINPSNVISYVYFEHCGKTYKYHDDIPDDDQPCDVKPMNMMPYILLMVDVKTLLA